MVMPHAQNNRYFSRWLDIKLRIVNATTRDAGTYIFKAVGRNQYNEKHAIFVDISIPPKTNNKHRKKLKQQKKRIRQQQAVHQRKHTKYMKHKKRNYESGFRRH